MVLLASYSCSTRLTEVRLNQLALQQYLLLQDLVWESLLCLGMDSKIPLCLLVTNRILPRIWLIFGGMRTMQTRNQCTDKIKNSFDLTSSVFHRSWGSKVRHQVPTAAALKMERSLVPRGRLRSDVDAELRKVEEKAKLACEHEVPWPPPPPHRGRGKPNHDAAWQSLSQDATMKYQTRPQHVIGGKRPSWWRPQGMERSITAEDFIVGPKWSVSWRIGCWIENGDNMISHFPWRLWWLRRGVSAQNESTISTTMRCGNENQCPPMLVALNLLSLATL